MVPVNRALREFFRKGDPKLTQQVNRELRINTGISWAILISIIGAIFAGGRCYEALIKNQEHMEQKIEDQAKIVAANVTWAHEHEKWAAAEAQKTTDAIDEIRHQLNMRTGRSQ